jgi:hypothetical protein
VGEFFSELLINKNLDVETLPAVGFEFLKNYFISINENQSKLLRLEAKKKSVSTIGKWVGATYVYATEKASDET